MTTLNEICGNCGHDKGTHRGTDHACSRLNDPKIKDQSPVWSRNFKFEPIQNKVLMEQEKQNG